MKIVFITADPYWQRDHHRFGLDYLMDKGYEVEIWRVITNRSIAFETQAGMYTGDYYFEYTEKAIKKQVYRNRNVLYYLNKTEESYITSIMRYGCKYILMTGMGGIIEPVEAEDRQSFTMKEKIKHRIEVGIGQSLKNFRNNTKKKYNRAEYIKLLKKNPPQLIVTSTKYAANKYLIPEELVCKIMYVHSMDYDRFLEARETNGERCILYCDSGFFDLDQDYILNSWSVPTAEHREDCLEQLNRLFERLEDYYGVPVVVAGHPHTKYGSDTFCGRRIVFNRIGDLAANAVAFVLQTSTALSFGAMNDLPTLQVVNSYFKEFGLTVWDKTSVYDYVKYQTETLGHGFLDLDDDEKMEHPWDYIKRMDELKRKEYLEKYIIDSDKTDRTTIEYIEEFIIKGSLEGVSS